MLPETQAEIVRMLLDDHSLTDIAAKLDLKQGTLRVYKHRAIKMLRDVVKGGGRRWHMAALVSREGVVVAAELAAPVDPRAPSFGHSSPYAPTTGQASHSRHRPRVKSGNATGALPFATLISDSSQTALSAAAS